MKLIVFSALLMVLFSCSKPHAQEEIATSVEKEELNFLVGDTIYFNALKHNEHGLYAYPELSNSIYGDIGHWDKLNERPYMEYYFIGSIKYFV